MNDLYDSYTMIDTNVTIEAEQRLGETDGQLYCILPTEMGCCYYAKRLNRYAPVELFFMHGDNWGQYGSETDHRPMLNNFLHGYTLIDEL